MLFCCLLIFFQNQLFRKILSGIPSECQTDWIQIRPNKMLGLIWLQSVCKGYQQIKVINSSNLVIASFFSMKRKTQIGYQQTTLGHKELTLSMLVGAQWLSGRVLDSRPRGRRLEPHRHHCVVVLEQDTFILA